MALKEQHKSYIPQIPYEDIVHVDFQENNILSEEEKTTMVNRLNRACRAGNLYRTKYKITFQTKSGILMVEATIWMVGQKYLLIKGNLCIPISSIVNIT